MNSNSKRHSNRLQFAALLRWVIISVFLGAAGLSYLYMQNQLYVLGQDRKNMEGDLRELIAQNNVLESQISRLTSFTALQRRLDDGFLKMVTINDHAVEHVRPQDASRRLASDNTLGNQYQTVSHETTSARR